MCLFKKQQSQKFSPFSLAVLSSSRQCRAFNQQFPGDGSPRSFAVAVGRPTRVPRSSTKARTVAQPPTESRCSLWTLLASLQFSLLHLVYNWRKTPVSITSIKECNIVLQTFVPREQLSRAAPEKWFVTGLGQILQVNRSSRAITFDFCSNRVILSSDRRQGGNLSDPPRV